MTRVRIVAGPPITNSREIEPFAGSHCLTSLKIFAAAVTKAVTALAQFRVFNLIASARRRTIDRVSAGRAKFHRSIQTTMIHICATDG